MTTFPSGFDDAVSVTGTDYVLLNNKRATVNQLGAVIGGGTPLAEWNGTDLTQFDAAITSGFTNPSFSVVTSGSRKVIQFTADAASAGAYCIRWFTTPVSMQSMTWRTFINHTVGLGDDLRSGVAIAGVNGTVGVDLFAIVHAMGITAAGTGTTGARYIEGAAAGWQAEFYAGGGVGDLAGDITWWQIAATVPDFILRSSTLCPFDAPNNTEVIYGSGLGMPALDAGWASETPNRVGIYFLSEGATNSVVSQIFELSFEAR